MPHITLIMLILSFGVGLAAIAVSAQIYRRYGFGYLAAHLAIVISFNLMIFVNIIAIYIFGLPEGAVPGRMETAAGIGHRFLVPLLQLLAAYYFVQIIRGLLGKPVSARIGKVAWTFIAAYSIVQAIALAGPVAIVGLHLSQIVSHLVWFSTLGVICTVLLGTIRRIGRVGDRKKRYALRAYWLLLLAMITLVIILIALQYSGILTLTRYNFVTVLLIVAMNAVPILYLGWFAEKFRDTREGDREIGPDQAQLFDRYGISPREQEIIRLVCIGKTNREIAGELFISLQTVKDHVYRIFRKTGVKNRVQLVNLFLRTLDP